jgi:predicted Zn-dependent protease
MVASPRALEDFLQQIRKRGARGAEVLVEHADFRETASHRRGQPSARTWTESRVTGRCWDDQGRLGIATTEQQDVLVALELALARCATASPDGMEGPAERLGGANRGLNIDDRRLPGLTDEERLEVVVGNERAAGRESASVETGVFSLREERAHRIFGSSRGVMHEEWGTTFTCRASVTMRTDNGSFSLHDELLGRAFANVACLPFGAVLGQRGVALSQPGVPIDGPVRVLLPPRATGKLIAWLGDCFARSSAARGGTFLDQPGLTVNKRLHLIDDGLMHGGVRTRAFDDRGVPAVPLTLLREGVVDARYVTVRDARARDLRPTGHEHAGQLTPTNLVLNSGTRSIHALLSELGGTVFQIDDLPETAGIDPVTGAVDVPVNGVILERGKPVGALRGARLTGDLVTALNRVAALASDTDRVLHIDAPGLFLDGFSVVGGA